MDDIHKIKDCLRELAGGAPIETEVAKVLSVDGAVCKVSRVRDGMVIDRVRLNAISTADKGIVVTPKTGTYVLISRLGEVNWFVTLCGEVEKISIDAEADIVINGGQLGGLIKIEELVNRLNYIENKIGDLMDVFNNWEPTLQDGGAALKAMVTPWFVGQMQLSSRDKLEDISVKH